MRSWVDAPGHRAWLEDEGRRLLRFGLATPAPGGGAAWLDDDGRPDPTRPLSTWIAARTVHVYGVAALRGVPGARPVADAVLPALLPGGRLRDGVNGGWVESVGPGDDADRDKTAYTHAFVVLAAATATAAGLEGGAYLLGEAVAVLGERFWEEGPGMHADSWDEAWTHLDDYRGVNANMHSVEALLAAADVLDDDVLRRRALRIATRVVRWAREGEWRIPEHFTRDWQPLPEHHREVPDHPFQPYGATVGHGLEWSRLLLHVRAAVGEHGPGEELLEGARELYARAVADGWHADGAAGFVYTTDWSGRPVVRTRMHWVVAEAIGAAAALRAATGDERYEEDYRRWWDHAAVRFLDPVRGSWHHELDEQLRPSATVWPGKPDLYHAYQATVLPLLPAAPAMAVALRDGVSGS